ncbi:hypothetical protein ASPCADRAFT_158455 [Aspergillus carbonarius ITEM 5010]|uniref:SPIN90/Ldb17 leucine-rich domain-containing protein n=1 Tax=Aspergillus carbonarius (strain ITEM 5010) TaxID=602072 RepID=A0A1R3S0Y5_ASPC5|nr:hypothetical protein ASPCADRAFT_158455 [Aspergillus carbonarius ITEM 5010]
MDFEVSLESEQQFWDDEYLQSELDVTRCSYKLLASNIFVAHTDYVRRQMLYGLLQDDDPATLHLIGSFLLFDGRQHDVAFRMMNEEGLFPRLLELLQARNRKEEEGVPAGLHRLLMDMMYEMSRIQRIKIEDLVLVDDEFVKGLFDIIEDLSYDVNDPYHYPVIRVLLVLNEQFMISAHDPVDEHAPMNGLTNKIIKILSVHGNLYKTFGENIILLINREAETSLQLLTLKLLYLIFTTPSTYEYFFTNDLHVLVDILIRNLLDLPEEASALRHTYLRVLYPLLAHTQLKYPPFYKRGELKRVLRLLVHGQLSDGGPDREKIMHFDEVDETTRRLVLRCATVEWLQDPEPEKASHDEDVAPAFPASDSVPPDAEFGVPLETSRTLSPTSTVDSSPGNLSPTRLDGPSSSSSNVDTHRRLSQAQRLGMHLEPASSSSLSVQEVASQHVKPGVMTPSRNDVRVATENPTSPSKVLGKPKIKPLPPRARRWRGRREDEQPDRIPEDAQSLHTSPLIPHASIVGVNHVERAYSTSTIPPPVAGHTRRSASNPPPAVPPPRRSTHHHSASSPSTSNTVPPSQPPTSTLHSSKHGQKPEPPKTRRQGRARHGPTDSSDKSLHTPDSPAEHLDNDQQQQPNGHAGSETKSDATVSVEEALQNVSLGD